MNPSILEASLTGVFRLILIVLFIYYAFSFIMRSVMPLLMRKYVNEFKKQYTEENQRSREEYSQKKEGEVSIKFVNKDKQATHNSNDDDYVDYEEIK
jgi:hypothetical protein